MPIWTVSGRVTVRHGLPELRRNWRTPSPVAGARVEVSGRKRVAGVWGPWGLLGKDTTDQNGAFRVRANRDRLPRQFRVDVVLKNSRFVVYDENKNALSRALAGLAVLGANPGAGALEAVLSHTGRATLKAASHEIHRDQTGTTRRPGEHDLGQLQLRSGVAQAHGDVWVLFAHMWDFLKRNGVAFRGRVGLKYPHANDLVPDRQEASYANPFNKVCYIVANRRRNQLSTAVVLHELMHLWAFQHTVGEWKMAWQLAAHGTTHGGRQKPFVAFHEAFAEWAAIWMEQAVLPRDARTPGRPLSRQGLTGEGITRADEVEEFEDGWMAVFNLLTTSDLDQFDLNRPGRFARQTLPERCNTPRVPFVRVLRAMRKSRRQPELLRARDLRLRPVLNRIAVSDGSFTAGHAQAYRRLLDPSDTAQPWELLC